MKKNKITKLTIVAALCIGMMLTFTSCGSSQSDGSDEDYTLSGNHKVIVDTDTAADDAMALMLMAKAPNVELLGVTVLSGNVSLEQGSKNALMTLETAGRDDVPVYQGSDTKFSGTKIEPYSVFGEDGMGDKDLIHPSGSVHDGDGVDYIIDTVKANPDEVEILTLGPLTDVAKAIRKDPKTMSKVKRIWSMGTGGMSYAGNASPVAEFNVYSDVDAYDYVIDSGIPMTIVGYDVCLDEGVSMNSYDFETLKDSGECGEFLTDALSVFASENSDSEGNADVCDPVAAACLIWKDVMKSKLCGAAVVMDDCEAYGEVVFYAKGAVYDFDTDKMDYNIRVATKLNSKKYLHSVCDLLEGDV